MTRFERLDIAAGLITVGTTRLPGVFSRLTVNGEIEYDEIKVKGHSSPKRQHNGVKDQSIDLELLLTDGGLMTAIKKLGEVYNLFASLDSKAAPVVYDITHPHLAARRITQVLFKTMNSIEDNQIDSILVRISFVEYNPPVVTEEKRKQAAVADAAAETLSATAPESSAQDSPPFFAGFKEGVDG